MIHPENEKSTNEPGSKPPSQVIVTVVDNSEPSPSAEMDSAKMIEAFVAPIREVLNTPAVQSMAQAFASRMASDASVAQTRAVAEAELNKLREENSHKLAMAQQNNSAALEQARLAASKQLLVAWSLLGAALAVAFVYALDRKLIETSSLTAIGVIVGTAWTVIFGRVVNKANASAKT